MLSRSEPIAMTKDETVYERLKSEGNMKRLQITYQGSD
jgi:hypothetical protein